MKYELTNITKQIDGRTVHRIRALRNFANVRAGDLGGWVEHADNLSQRGNCWLYHDACALNCAFVVNNAKLLHSACARDFTEISNNAQVYGIAVVSKRTHVYDDMKINTHASVTPIHIIGLAYPITITDHHATIGCQTRTFDEWRTITPKQLRAIDGERAVRFWRQWRDTLNNIVNSRKIGQHH